ncbi:kin of IRRE-like protein 3 [Mytilus galloprovincialis]|uniref:kin of IRRE-like protein 3 n=1 Tax=Mytilus galloprovincialis TaxID=29158 RepID=UPI003F7B7766
MTMNVVLVSCFMSTIHFLEANQLALSGSTIQLICPYKSANIVWHYVNETSLVYLTEKNWVNSLLTPDLYRRLFITGNHGVGEYHLNIKDTRKSDEGIYRCTTKLKESNIFLTLIVGPTSVYIENVTLDNRIPGIEGQDMSIKCTAVGGQPPPDMQLVILGSTFTGKQSTQHTFKPVSSHDGSTITCQAGYTDINYFQLNTTAYIHLKLTPIITPFNPYILNTEETKYFDVSCKSTGSRPAASMYWLLGQQNITSNSTSQSNEESSTNKYIVTSYLRYRADRRYNGQKLKCRASNVAGVMETSLTLDVKYAPGVTVGNKTFSQTQSTRQIHSTLYSNPPVNTCTWHHRSKYGEIIRDFSNNNQTLTLPTVSEHQRYQDTGEYIYTAENGIVGMNGQLKQTGSGYVISNAPPVITADNKDSSTQYGQFGKSTKVYVTVYSIPKYSSISWYIGNIQLVSNKYVINEEPVIVKDVFHGVEVQLDGYRVTMTISDLQEADFTNYTLRLYYGSQYVQHEVTLESASAPETPSNFTIIGSGETSITVQWIPGYDGGQIQTYYVQYCITGTSIWFQQEIKTSNQLDLYKVYTLTGLQDETSYELRMYAKNKINQSQHTNVEAIRTQSSEGQTSSNAIIGTVAGVLVVLLIVCAVIVSILIFKKRKGKKETKKNAGFYENSGFGNVQIGDKYEEVVSKSGTQEKQTSKNYEALRTKETVDVYDDLENSKGLQPTNSTSKTYESLGPKYTVEMYDDLDNHKGLPSSKPSVDHYDSLCTKDKPNVYEELENQKGQTEKVYVNEAF